MAYQQTRIEVQRVCAHVIARERHGRDGHIGLAWTGRGVGTDRLWLEGDGLHRPDGAVQPLTTLVDLAAFAGVDLEAPFSAGHDTPPLGDRGAPLAVDRADLDRLLDFFAAVWPTLVDLAAGAPVTLWPEHFDAAFVRHERANVGASPGDGFSDAPYLYVGPWGPERPGDPGYWNAGFGAFQPFSGRVDDTRTFLERGISLLET